MFVIISTCNHLDRRVEISGSLPVKPSIKLELNRHWILRVVHWGKWLSWGHCMLLWPSKTIWIWNSKKDATVKSSVVNTLIPAPVNTILVNQFYSEVIIRNDRLATKGLTMSYLKFSIRQLNKYLVKSGRLLTANPMSLRNEVKITT